MAAFTAVVSLSPAYPEGPKTQLGRLVVVGDSVTAGFENFSLYDSAQIHGYPALIAQQAGVGLPLPLVSYPGIPPALTLGPGNTLLRASGIGFRYNPAEQTLNLSVPGFTLADGQAHTFNLFALLQAGTNANVIDLMAFEVLAPLGPTLQPCAVESFDPGTGNLTLSEVDCATKLNPSTIIVSLGNNDALQSLTFGMLPTDPGTFAAQYQAIVTKLKSTGANLLLANIPDVSILPFLVPVPAVKVQCSGKVPANATDADYIVPDILSVVPSADLCNATPLQVRPAALIQATRAATMAYNQIIAGIAKSTPGVAVADVNGLLAKVAANGYKVGPDTITTAYLGGIFSLDGIHPTTTGQAVLANLFIETMNSQLNMNINTVNVRQIEKSDPLVFGKHP
jgi:lysophospholipase L1-like esterase